MCFELLQCIGSAAVHLARNVHAKAIVAFTHTGKSALDVARSRPDSSCPVIALADTEVRVCSVVMPIVCVYSSCSHRFIVAGNMSTHGIDSWRPLLPGG